MSESKPEAYKLRIYGQNVREEVRYFSHFTHAVKSVESRITDDNTGWTLHEGNRITLVDKSNGACIAINAIRPVDSVPEDEEILSEVVYSPDDIR
jgi:hypothetical protein